MTDTKKQKMLPILAVVIVLLVAGIYMSQKGVGKNKTITPAEAKTKAEAFIKDTLLGGKTKFTISDATEYAGLYKMAITLEGGGEPIDSYMTKDGKIFLPQGMDIEKMNAEAKGEGDKAGTGDKTEEPVAEAPKTDKPKVELFVMSHCPYGTQIEKGILPVVKALSGKIDFQLKFVDYAMHDKKELDEQTRQYCINKEQGAKFIPYLECFLKAGDSSACVKEQKVDEKKLASCVSATDKQFKISETYSNKDSWGSQFPPFPIYKDDNTKYGVQGSPTLVINGKQISAGRDAASLAKAICGAFNDGKAPKECQNKFASESPAPGFGTGTQAAGSGSDATCN